MTLLRSTASANGRCRSRSGGPAGLVLGLVLLAELALPAAARQVDHPARAGSGATLAPPAQPLPRATRGDPVRLLPRGRPGRLVFGVMGSAAPEPTIPAELKLRLERLGQAIARRGDVVLTGACPGMPQVTARAAKARGGHTVGISPAGSLTEHTRVFHSPTAGLDVIKMTGAGPGMGFIAREEDNIRHSDILVFAGGRSGTLGEMLFAMQEPKVIALLEGSTGVAEQARARILPHLGRGRGVVVSDRDPDRLIRKAVTASETLRRREARPEGALATLAARLAGSAEPRPPRVPLPPMERGAPVSADLARDHNVFAFFGTARGMSASDQGKVKQLIGEIASRRPGGRAPVLMVPTRRGLGGQVARAAHRQGVLTVGVSPAGTPQEHLEERQLVRGLDRISLTGEGPGVGRLSAYQHGLQHTDVVFVAGGDHQTLGGTIFAMYRPMVVAVLETAGMAGKLRSDILSTFDKPAVARMVFDTDPVRLYRRATAEAQALRRSRPKEYVAPE